MLTVLRLYVAEPYYGPPSRSAHGPIRTGRRAPHKKVNSTRRTQRPSRQIPFNK